MQTVWSKMWIGINLFNCIHITAFANVHIHGEIQSKLGCYKCTIISVSIFFYTMTTMQNFEFFYLWRHTHLEWLSAYLLSYNLFYVFIPGGGKKATKITVAIAVGIWFLAFLTAVPALVGSHIKAVRDGSGKIRFSVCYPFPENWLNKKYPKVMVMSKFLVLYVIPLIIIFGFYVSIAVSLIMSTRNVPGELQGMHRQVKYYWFIFFVFWHLRNPALVDNLKWKSKALKDDARPKSFDAWVLSLRCIHYVCTS